MEEKTLRNQFGRVPKVLLLGNGINRAYHSLSWSELIESIRTKELTDEEKKSMETVPYPLQPVILTEDHLGTQMKKISPALSELRAMPEEGKILREYIDLPIDTILTTNYTYELETALDTEFRCLPNRRCKMRKIAYQEGGTYNTRQLHTYFSVDDKSSIWHIHGEAARHDTMVLGHYYYGKLLAKMQQYVSSLIARFHVSQTKQQDMEMRSWVDYFLLGDVYIVGFGMSLSELDLWWLVNCKKRHFPNTQVILYKPDIHPEEKLLAEAYGIKVESWGDTSDYMAYYHCLCEKLRESMS